MSFNLATILTEAALAAPDAPVNIFSGVVTTYRELDEQSSLLAAGLSETGLSPGQVVALQLPNLPQFLTAYFGILKAGMVVLPLNPQLMAPEIEYQLADSGAAIMIGLSGMHAEADRACQRLGVPLYLVRTSAPLPPGTQRATDLIGIAPAEIVSRSADDTAVLAYTSGTGGRPRGGRADALPAVHELHGSGRAVRCAPG